MGREMMFRVCSNSKSSSMFTTIAACSVKKQQHIRLQPLHNQTPLAKAAFILEAVLPEQALHAKAVVILCILLGKLL